MNSTCVAAFFNQTSSACYFVQTVETMKWTSDQNCMAFLRVGEFVPDPHPHHRHVAIVVGSILGSLGLIALLMLVLNRCKFSPVPGKNKFRPNSISYSFSQIQQITAGLKTLIGKGGFAQVYKGTIEALEGRRDVAVKVLNETLHQGNEFLEMNILLSLHHRNVVELLGYCCEKSYRILVYEYLPNGSLDQWIFGERSSSLSWSVRSKIALGIAKGMAYLHEECSKKVLHLDLKPQNILLDSDFVPKVADFGLAKFMNINESFIDTANVQGTIGYMAPELIMRGGLSDKTDVYSYGVMMLETVSGQKSNRLYERLCTLLELAKEEDLVDEAIQIQGPKEKEEAVRLVRVASLCLQRGPSSRPSMTEIARMLEGLLPVPLLTLDQKRMLKHEFSSANQGQVNATINSGQTSSTFPTSSLHPR